MKGKATTPLSPEERLSLTQFTMDHFSDPSILMDESGCILYANDTACRLLEYDRNELLSLHIWDIDPQITPAVHERNWKKMRHMYTQNKRTGAQLETTNRTKSGRIFPVEISMDFFVFQGNEYLVGTGRDITERKRVEEERERLLREIEGQRNRLHTILDSLPVSLFIMDREGRTLFANRIARADRGGAFPASIGELAKTRIWWADTGKPFDVWESGLVRALDKGEPTHRDIIEVEQKGGARVVYISSVVPMFDASGEVAGTICINLDITEMRKLERELDESRNQAELYLDLMGHDITNMNQVLMGYLELIEAMREAGNIDRELIDNSIKIIKRSSRMIDDVKKLTQLRTAKAALIKVDLCGVLSMLKARYSAVPDRSVTINYTPAQDCTVMANDLLANAFDNLMDNAIKHSKGPVTIDLVVDHVTIDGCRYCRVEVADSGPGIPPDLKKKIFMTPGEIREKTVRRGFGMYLVRMLIDYYRGQVWVEDRVPGDYTKGAKVVVLLPVAPA
ncbi:MAG: sensory histidine kinase AtoS [Methanocella sp. PtaU1.Bin125]|nr:MAG: sensory histidine kinase AtoS [Methanocella sp. PtaU1.Bin125]